MENLVKWIFIVRKVIIGIFTLSSGLGFWGIIADEGRDFKG